MISSHFFVLHLNSTSFSRLPFIISNHLCATVEVNYYACISVRFRANKSLQCGSESVLTIRIVMVRTYMYGYDLQKWLRRTPMFWQNTADLSDKISNYS